MKRLITYLLQLIAASAFGAAAPIDSERIDAVPSVVTTALGDKLDTASALTLGTINTGQSGTNALAQSDVRVVHGKSSVNFSQAALTADVTATNTLTDALGKRLWDVTADAAGWKINLPASGIGYGDLFVFRNQDATDSFILAEASVTQITVPVGTIATAEWDGAEWDYTIYYNSDQNTRTTDAVTFATVTTGTTNFTVSAGTEAVDFAAVALYRTLSIAANTTFTGSNYAAGKAQVYFVTCDGTQRTLTFPANWVFMGTKPANIAASKIGTLSLLSTTTADTGVRARWGVQE